MSNKLLSLSIMLLISVYGCKNNSEKKISSEDNHLQKQIFNIVDSMSTSFPKEYPVNLYTVSHQKKIGKDYIKISTAEFFNKDSVSTVELDNKNLIFYYSKNFFKNSKKDLIPYKGFEYTDSTISLYHPRYIIFEVSKNNIYRIIPIEKSIEMELFNYDDIYVPEPIPKTK